MARAQDSRPLSPHVGIYRWQITNTLSILHRLTGVALSFGLVMFAAWLWAAAYSPECYATLQEYASTLLGKLALFGWTVCFYYHLGNGMRHLNWDIGRGFALPEVTRSGVVVVAFALSMSIFTWAMVLRNLGVLHAGTV
jgi:succinate dehydrogenase / fumarate reductase cytochrome b subunit